MSDEQRKNRLARVAREYWMPEDVREAIAWALGSIDVMTKAYDLLLKGFESAEEIRGELKQRCRNAERERDELKALTLSQAERIAELRELLSKAEAKPIDYILAMNGVNG